MNEILNSMLKIQSLRKDVSLRNQAKYQKNFWLEFFLSNDQLWHVINVETLKLL